ncbi:MAG: hypothetical protein R3E12_08075 [Candidatus Eisenbacteria bacterium]
MFDRLEELLVEHLRLQIALLALRCLILEAGSLIDRSLSSLKAFPNSTSPMKISKRSTSSGSSRWILARGEMALG